jgi:omega-6 fatty acid desaturase (delta-12 desaturase)
MNSTQIIKDKVNNIPENDFSWQKIVLKYNTPSLRKSTWQLCNSIIPYFSLWFLMYYSLRYPYWVTLLLAFVASGFLIRIFIIFHDCAHGSFFKSQSTNKLFGMICGILTFTPYHKWQHLHNIHHATASNLDKRGIGDIWTLTVDEYRNSSKWKRFFYRAFRNPFFMFTLGPLFLLLIHNRLTTKIMTAEDRKNIYFTNILLFLIVAGMFFLLGLKAFLLIQVPLILISHVIGIWLFFIQHQFEDVEWDRNIHWNYKKAAMHGSSYLKLPAILQWFTGNIGYHHVHHLSPRIPNYNLERCHFENEMFSNIKPIKFLDLFRAFSLHLWDEQNQTMIPFRKAA